MAGLDEHVQLVGYRELMDLARQKRAYDAEPLPEPSSGGCPAPWLQPRVTQAAR